MSAHVTGRSQPTTGHPITGHPTTGQPTTGLSRPVLVRAAEAEHLESIGHILLADSSATHGALSSHRVALGRGAAGAVPHRHDQSSELFFILDGQLDVLAGDDIIAAGPGDLLIVPPGRVHAFGAHRDSSAEALIIITPGVERFDYFRHVARWRAGTEPRETLLAMQDRFDTHFTDSAAWNSARTSA